MVSSASSVSWVTQIPTVADQVAKILTPAAKAAWSIAIHQVYVWSFGNAIATVALGAAAYAIYRASRACYNTAKEATDNWDESNWKAGGATVMVLCVVVICASCYTLYLFGAHLLNPAYYALQVLRGLVP